MRSLPVYAVAAVLSLNLVACGSTASVKLNPKIAAAIPDKTSFVLVDARPADERVSSMSGGSYGETRTYGDDTLVPPVPDLLKAWLHNNASADLAGKTITLDKFTVNVLDPTIVTIQGMPDTGLVGRGFAEMMKDKLVYVRISGKVGGEEFSARESASFKARVSEDNVQATLVGALDKAVADIRRAAAVK